MKRIALALVAVACLSGCTIIREADRQQILDSSATNYEAAKALTLGADPKPIAAVIQANASAICHALGSDYPVVPAVPSK